ncbi:MAG TPA: hypothetical protein VFK48_18775 [Usitatibacter sp.]|nr:hypothetical protein [Usitatibacter sp.]
MAGRFAALAWALAASSAQALDSPQWPPPESEAARMRELQQAIVAPDSTPAQREAAREALGNLLKSPAGQVRGRTPDERPPRPARAAIDPLPSVITPSPTAPRLPATLPPASSEVARLEVVDPPRPAVNPRTGSAAAPTGRFAVDPRTGGVLHEAGNGYVDPRTGQFMPR